MVFFLLLGPVARATASHLELGLRHLHHILNLRHNFKWGGAGKGCWPHPVEGLRGVRAFFCGVAGWLRAGVARPAGRMREGQGAGRPGPRPLLPPWLL